MTVMPSLRSWLLLELALLMASLSPSLAFPDEQAEDQAIARCEELETARSAGTLHPEVATSLAKRGSIIKQWRRPIRRHHEQRENKRKKSQK